MYDDFLLMDLPAGTSIIVLMDLPAVTSIIGFADNALVVSAAADIGILELRINEFAAEALKWLLRRPRLFWPRTGDPSGTRRLYSVNTKSRGAGVSNTCTERGMGSGCHAIGAPLALTHGRSVACFGSGGALARDRC